MFNPRTLVLTALCLISLIACNGTPVPQAPTALPQATAAPTSSPVPQATVPTQATPGPTVTSAAQASPTTAPTARPTLTPAPIFPQGIVTEPLTVVSTNPAAKANEVPIGRDQVSIVVQFNHPVVPLVSVDTQRSLPQPLTIQPALQGQGQWLNTSTYIITPTQNLTVATQYTVTITPGLKDVFGQGLSSPGAYAWSFTTISPAIIRTYPADNTRFAGVSTPITITFNTEMDRASTEARFSVKRMDTGAAAPGKVEWQGAVMRFLPDQPLAYNLSYVAELKTGAQDINKIAASTRDFRITFRTTPPPGVTSTLPANNDSASKAIRDGFRIDFASPMDRDGLKVTIAPTITNQNLWWEYGKDDTIAHVAGGWLASQTYTVTIGADSRTREGEKLGKDAVVRFTAAPLDPSVNLNTPNFMGMYDANVPQVIYSDYTNVTRIDYRLFRVDRTDLLPLLGRNRFSVWDKYRPPAANLVREWSQSVQSPLNAVKYISTTLAAGGAALTPGVYYLDATAPGSNTSRHLLVVSPVNVALKRTESEALLWVTDLKTGKPVSNQPLTIYGPDGKALSSGQTDADGVLRKSFDRLWFYEPLFALSETGGQVVAAVGSDWNTGINTYDFNLPSQPETQDYYGNLYTDRAIYRPGQTVYFKGILRRDNDASYLLPTDVVTVPIKLRDENGREVFAQGVALDKFGAFDGQLELSDAASLGFYNLSLEIGQEQRRFFANTGFQVAEYKAPEYQVNVKADKPEYINGDTIRADVDSSYFFGGAVANADVTWRLLTEDLFFQAPNITGWWDFTDYDLTTDRRHQGEVIRDGKGKTDGAGKFHFEVPADLKDFPLSQTFTLEAEVKDINNQSVSSRIAVPVHKGRFYIGLHPQRYVGTANQEQAVDVITVDTKGISVTNQSLAASVYERQWYSVRTKLDNGEFYWKSAFTDTLVSKVDVTTDASARAVVRFTPPRGGVYRIVAEGQDAASNKVRSATYVWVSTTQYVNWRIDNNDRIDLVADKKEYVPGDLAEVLIPAPFADSEALLTIERGTIRQVKRLSLKGNSEKIQIPITSDFAPNVFVSVMLVKGRTTDSPAPQFKLGYVNLAVSTTEKVLNVQVTPDKKTSYGPGEKATFNLQATDASGKPVEAEFSVALVDKAIQSLADDPSTPLLAAFYGQRGLGISTAGSLIRSIERINQTLQSDAKGGGGGALQQPVRRDFRDTAYWNARVVTDPSGKAQVAIPLPDNLTTWNLTAKGVTADTRVGEARTDILSTKDLLVRPVTPRFFVVGDKARLEAVVNNNTDKDVSADVRIDAQGLTLNENATKPLTIKAHDKGKVTWETTVNPVDQATLRFTVSGGGLTDAYEVALPIQRGISPEVVATAGQVETRNGEQILVPANADKTAGDLRIDLSPSLAAASLDSLSFLQSFEYECTEQTVSKFFPNVVIYNTLKRFGIDRPDLRKALEVNVSRELQRLYSQQHSDGGWGWWATDESSPMLTAYVLYGMSAARAADFAVDANVMTRADQFLTRYLDQPADVKLPYTYNERAFVIFVLTDSGRVNVTSRAVNLYDQRANLGQYGKAYLLMALQKAGQSQAQALRTELTSAAIVSATGTHWEEARPDWRLMNTNTRTTALVIMALARNDPKNPVLTNAVRWLMAARKEGHWETTQETAWSVLALNDYMGATGELDANYTYQVMLNGKPLGEGKVDKSSVIDARTLTVSMRDLVQNAANDLILQKSGDAGKLYYSAYLRYYLPVDQMPALNRGILIGRQYLAVDQKTLKPTDKSIASASIGDYVLVKLTIIAPTDLSYLLLEDPLPAGFEAVDTTLKTSSVAASGAGLQKQPEASENVPFWFQPYWAYWAHSEVRDDRVAVFATYLGRGTYEYSYMMRASLAGEFRALPARAYEMYFPEVMGRSTGALFGVSGN